MRILVNGRAFKEYAHKGQSVIEARHGSNYSVKIKNDNSHRVMAVLSVDGLDVISGKPAEDVNKGYIIDAYSYVEIKGYRISDANSAAFIFSSKGQSYVANTKGTARNCGVIGVRVFKEKEKPAPPMVVHHHHHAPIVPQPIIMQPYYTYPWNPWNTGGYVNPWNTGGYVAGTTYTTTGGSYTTTGGSYTTTGNSVMYAANGVFAVNDMSVTGTAGGGTNTNFALGGTTTSANLSQASVANSNSGTCTANFSNAFDNPISYKQFDTGTAWGKKLDDKVKREYFERGELLAELVVHYASKHALVNMGIDLEDDPRIAENQAPQAFGSKYCEPPKGWQG